MAIVICNFNGDYGNASENYDHENNNDNHKK